MTDTRPAPSRTISQRVRVALLVLLVLYWLTIFIGTHIPRVPRALAEQGDKVLHLVAYGGLAMLLLSWQMSRGRIAMRTVALTWLVIAGYGVFDETTQPLVGRFCDLGDWIADTIGATVGLAVTWPLASKLFARLQEAR